MAEYSYTKICVDTQQIWDAISNASLPTPDSVDNEVLMFYGQPIMNPNKVIITYSTPLSGGDQTSLNGVIAGLNTLPDDAHKSLLADWYIAAGFQILTGLSAKCVIDGKTESQAIAWYNQIEPLMNPLQSGFLQVAYNKWTGLLSLLTNILTGTMTSTEVAEIRNLLEKLLGKTLT
jgi:hypothetical protein